MKREQIEYCHASPKGDNLFEWAIVIDGPKDTVYEGGTFFAELFISKNYPFEAPEVLRIFGYDCFEA